VLTTLELASLNDRVSLNEHRAWANETYSERRIDAPSRMLDVDAAWDAIHRCLGDGTLSEDTGKHPLRVIVLGGEPMKGDKGFIMRLNSPPVVQNMAPIIAKIDKKQFRECYFTISADDYLMAPNDGDFQYTWTYFQQVQLFYERAADAGDYVLFTAYQ
jgi:hypothetical protein